MNEGLVWVFIIKRPRSAVPVQGNGNPLTVGSITCVLDENTGAMCKDASTGHYFQAARQANERR